MALERTFSIIKPDATERNLTGKVNSMIEAAGLRIIGQRRIQMTEEQAKRFYEVHAERPFYGELVEFMTSGPVVVQVLEGENAVAAYREVMGATNPAEAAEDTSVRKLLNLSARTLSTVLTALRTLRSKSLSSSHWLTSQAKRPRKAHLTGPALTGVAGFVVF